MFRAFQSSTLSAKERQYHRDWVKLYGLANGLDLDGPLILDADHVMKFLVGLKQQGKPAWMRLKAVREQRSPGPVPGVDHLGWITRCAWVARAVRGSLNPAHWSDRIAVSTSQRNFE